VFHLVDDDDDIDRKEMIGRLTVDTLRTKVSALSTNRVYRAEEVGAVAVTVGYAVGDDDVVVVIPADINDAIDATGSYLFVFFALCWWCQILSRVISLVWKEKLTTKIQKEMTAEASCTMGHGFHFLARCL
jgi:hypothetical protein